MSQPTLHKVSMFNQLDGLMNFIAYGEERNKNGKPR